MSGLLAGKVWQSALAPHLKPLAAALADIGNDDGTSIYPSVAYIAWLLGRSERAVQYGLDELRKVAVLVVEGNAQGGRYATTHYRMVEERFPTRKPWREIRKGATVSPIETDNGATLAPIADQKGATNDRKGCNLRQERVKPVAPEPSLTVIEPKEKNISAPLKRAARALEPPGFIRFWEAYPRKLDRKEAARVWTKAGLELFTDEVLTGLARWASCEQWQDEQYVPHATTFLNKRRWEVEPPRKGATHGHSRPAGAVQSGRQQAFQPDHTLEM